MKPEKKAESKIFTKKANTNKKLVGPDMTEKPSGSSALMKNEFAVILLGALLLTIIIFFIFFRSSGTKSETADMDASATSFANLEKRIEKIEKALQLDQNPDTAGVDIKGSAEETKFLKERIERLETAFSVKFDSILERMGKIEKSISAPAATSAAVSVKKAAESKPAAAAAPVKKPAKKKSIFHTVEKKETLYSISKKYNTTVQELMKLNNLTKDSKIYPGDNIIVR